LQCKADFYVLFLMCVLCTMWAFKKKFLCTFVAWKKCLLASSSCYNTKNKFFSSCCTLPWLLCFLITMFLFLFGLHTLWCVMAMGYNIFTMA
jgi:hypothetical protein